MSDLVGARFGRWTVIGVANPRTSEKYKAKEVITA